MSCTIILPYVLLKTIFFRMECMKKNPLEGDKKYIIYSMRQILQFPTDSYTMYYYFTVQFYKKIFLNTLHEKSL